MKTIKLIKSKLGIATLFATLLFATACQREYNIKSIEGCTIAVSEVSSRDSIPTYIIELIKKDKML